MNTQQAHLCILDVRRMGRFSWRKRRTAYVALESVLGFSSGPLENFRLVVFFSSGVFGKITTRKNVLRGKHH